MAIYGTRAEFVATIGEQSLLRIVDRDADDQLDTELLDGAVTRATEMVSGYISEYLPQLVVVPSLTQATYWIAFELLHVGNQSTEDSRLGYDRAIKWLGSIAKGDVKLPGQPTGDDGSIDPGDPLVCSGDRVWNRATVSRLF